jgi:hypothetical protein
MLLLLLLLLLVILRMHSAIQSALLLLQMQRNCQLHSAFVTCQGIQASACNKC